MNAVTKKKIVNLSSDIIAAAVLFGAILCLFVKSRNFRTINFDGINIMAAKSIFSRGNFNFPTNNLICNFEKNHIREEIGNTKINGNEVGNNFFIKPSNINLPDFSKEKPEHHSSDEPTHKIIESQFSSGGTKFENFYVKNTTDQNIDIGAELSKEPAIKITKTKDPQVLIFHTHTSESYMNEDQGFFYESFYPRSMDDSKNVTRVGQAITDKLIENGINTIHDTTYHDTPSYNGSYSRAATTIKKNLEKYPSIQVVIDIHRDSLGSKETGKIKPTFKYKDKKAAQLMVISGCDPNNSLGFPNWEKNLRLALRVQKYCETLFPGIARPLNFSKVKYNEHITTGSLLIEVGSDVNTLEEAVYTGSMLGESLSKLLNDLKK